MSLISFSPELTLNKNSNPSPIDMNRTQIKYIFKFGEFGMNNGQLTEPSGVAVNCDNDIIIADTDLHRIQVFDKDGRFKFKFGECGSEEGQLLYPNKVNVVKSTGDIIVTERSPTNQIQIYNKHGKFLRRFSANFLDPRGVCVDSKDRIIVVDGKIMKVLIFDLMGNLLKNFDCSKYIFLPSALCSLNCKDREEIYISDNKEHCVKAFDYDGNFIRQIGGKGVTTNPIGVKIDSNDEILVFDNHNGFNVTIFNQDGQFINALMSHDKTVECLDMDLMDNCSIVLSCKDNVVYLYEYKGNSLCLSDSGLA